MVSDLGHTWKTIKSHRIGKASRWKSPLGQSCPHGLDIFLVDGSHVRNVYDSDFDQGGNSFAYSFVPEGQIWIDDHVPVAERPYVVFHECHEAEDMRKGKSYDTAHVAAKKIEDRMRKRDRPGER